MEQDGGGLDVDLQDVDQPHLETHEAAKLQQNLLTSHLATVLIY